MEKNMHRVYIIINITRMHGSTDQKSSVRKGACNSKMKLLDKIIDNHNRVNQIMKSLCI